MQRKGKSTPLHYAKRTINRVTEFSCNTATPSKCDIVIQFPKNCEEEVISWISISIAACSYKLKTTTCKHEATGTTHLLCSSSFKGLLKGAEEIQIKKTLKSEHGGQLRDFYSDDLELYDGCESLDEFFTNEERQRITLHILNNIRVKKTLTCAGLQLLEGQAILPILSSKRFIKQIFPLHTTNKLNELRNEWVFDFSAQQPLDKIRCYFGVHIAMYFTFLGHYTTWLTIPTVCGLIVWFYSGISQEFDDVMFILLALLNVIWSTCYIELWKRREAEHAYKWGTLDKQDDLITEPRPLFTGTLSKSAVTGRLEPHYPKWRRNLFFYSVSLPVMIFCHLVILLVCMNFFILYDFINNQITAGEMFFIFKPLPNIFLAVAVMVMDKCYGKIAVWLNDKENYRNEEEYKNHLIIKLMVFQSVNSFLSLFYTAFYIQDFTRLRNQLAVLFIVRQVVGNMKESLLSFAMAKLKQYKGASGAEYKEILTRLTKSDTVEDLTTASEDGDNKDLQDNGAESTEGEETEFREKSYQSETSGKKSVPCMTQAEAESLLPPYDGTFDDYLEMVIQFSYVTWFSSIFPLAGLFALLNNIVEIRSDAFKLCMSFQRPVGEITRDIGAWKTVLEVMSIGTIIVNTALIGVSGPMQRIFPNLDNGQRILLIVIIEHVVIALKFVIRLAISDVPDWVSVEMAKLEFTRREALRHDEPSNPHDVKTQPSHQGLQMKTPRNSESRVSPDRKTDGISDPGVNQCCSHVLEGKSGYSSVRDSPARDLNPQTSNSQQSPLLQTAHVNPGDEEVLKAHFE